MAAGCGMTLKRRHATVLCRLQSSTDRRLALSMDLHEILGQIGRSAVDSRLGNRRRGIHRRGDIGAAGAWRDHARGARQLLPASFEYGRTLVDRTHTLTRFGLVGLVIVALTIVLPAVPLGPQATRIAATTPSRWRRSA